jgi:hypothetical protein
LLIQLCFYFERRYLRQGCRFKVPVKSSIQHTHMIWILKLGPPFCIYLCTFSCQAFYGKCGKCGKFKSGNYCMVNQLNIKCTAYRTTIC